MDYEDGQPVPPGYRLEEGPNHGLVTAGVVTLSIFYGLGALNAAGAGFENHSGWLLLPVAGPFLTVGSRESNCGDGDTGCEVSSGLTSVLLIIDGAGQVTGAALLLAGLASERLRLVREDVAHVTLTPAHLGTGYGLAAYGSF